MVAGTQRSDDGESPLQELCGKGWEPLDPTTEAQERSNKRIIGNYKGDPITVGFRIDEPAYEEGEKLHEVYRTGQYNVHLKIESLGQGMAEGQIKVDRASGYGNQQS